MNANLRGLGVMALLGLFALANPAAEEFGRVEGVITYRGGFPLSNALVVVVGAVPREVAVADCAACSADCGKHARTDADGQFTIGKLDTSLVFKLVVAAQGFEPAFIENADPKFGRVQKELDAVKPAQGGMTNPIVGRLIGPKGQPVVGAVLSVDGIQIASSKRIGGGWKEVERWLISDEQGAFTFHCSNDVTAISVKVEACGYSRFDRWLDSGKSYLLRLHHGATFSGRLLFDGQPVAGLLLDLTSHLGEESAVMRFDAPSDEEGRFVFAHLPKNRRLQLFTSIVTMRQGGIWLPVQAVTTGGDESQTDLGDLATRRALYIQGRVVLSDGKPTPRTQLTLQREDVYDRQEVFTRGDDGQFELAGLPGAQVTLSLRVSGYHLSEKNPNREGYREWMIVGRLDENQDDFVILVDPGRSYENPTFSRDFTGASTNTPLRGAKL